MNTTNKKALDNIHNSIINGQKKQMVNQIDKLFLYDFWHCYCTYLENLYSTEMAYDYFKNALITYYKIKKI